MSKYVVFNILCQGIVGKEKKCFPFPFFFTHKLEVMKP